MADTDQHGSEDPFTPEVIRQENVKHLEMIQAIVTRLASNSFLIKTWAITIAAAAYGISVNRLDSRLAIIGVVAIAIFWILDSYFLRQERLFRLLYDHVRLDTNAVSRFSMKTTRFNRRVHQRAVFFSLTLTLFYGLLIGIGVTLAIVAHALALPMK